MPSTTESAPRAELDKVLPGLALRSIGPAFMGGRIADIAVHPSRPSTWYVAVGSGGLWKTTNAGTTWTPLFDDQVSYSIGCVSIDPTHPDVVWVGTGEAVSGRHVGWGDGVYRSRDGGKTWDHMGLDRSEHVSRILIDPRDTDVILVAAEGPLWGSGGDRGVYRSTDGGARWTRVLHIDDNTGVSSLEFAPGDPSTVYAAAYQRRRHVASFVGGGPGSGIHVSDDGGTTWRRITEGLPAGDMGKIGLAVTPADPNLVYATVEAAESERGFYRSTDRGASWERRNPYISGGTGPHYYQRLFASPSDPALVFQVDVFVHVTRDGGATITQLESGRTKHSDNHAIWIDPRDGQHLLVGTDAGLYETFDQGMSFRHVSNLPVSQFYRVALDNTEPFYNVLGGAQDLGTLFGPSRTTHIDGVRNQDWWVPLGSDGYHVAFDPHDDDTFYLEWQVGNVMRYDRRTMEMADIQPQGQPDDPPERWNWDTPIVVSAHRRNRLYVASQRVWRSDDRGDSWTPISPDLTSGQNRYELAVVGRVHSVDALYDHRAMSLYSTISCLCESPIDERLLYVGTDDGLIQRTEDGGSSWRGAGALPDLPAAAFINDVEACRHERAVVFVAADDHKSGDFTPYLFESRDAGQTWRSLRGDLPDGAIVWAVQQDHIDPDLLFLGTERGIFVTIDRGEHWYQLSSGVPTISFRDVKIHPRDNDLVGASFGRGFYVLDDYSPLRSIDAAALTEPATLFGVRDAWWYVPYQPMQAPGQPTLGSTAFRVPNPDFGATFTYHLAADIPSARQRRTDAEKQLIGDGDDVPFPGVDSLWNERLEAEPVLLLVVRNAAGEPVRQLSAEKTAGLHRASWDLRRAVTGAINLDEPAFAPPWEQPPRGPLVAPGTYSVELTLVTGTRSELVAGPQTFAVKPVPATAGRNDAASNADFAAETARLARLTAEAAAELDRTREQLRRLHAELLRTPGSHEDRFARLDTIRRRLEELARRLTGDPVLEQLSEAAPPSIRSLVERVATHHWGTTQPPTTAQRSAVQRAAAAFEPWRHERSELEGELDALVEAIRG